MRFNRDHVQALAQLSATAIGSAVGLKITPVVDAPDGNGKVLIACLVVTSQADGHKAQLGSRVNVNDLVLSDQRVRRSLDRYFQRVANRYFGGLHGG